MTDIAPDRAGSSGRAERHDPVYDDLAQSQDFDALRRAYRGFAFPASVAFLAWYLLYVVMSNWAGGFMDTRLVGNINVALVFGLLQFASTFALAFVYSRYSTRKLDPLAERIDDAYESGRSRR